MKTYRIASILAVLAVAAVALPAWGQDKADEKAPGVAVTVYNGGYGVVRDVRKLPVADGMMKFTDVAALIDATTVHFKSFTDPAAKLLEQNYQYDLVSADKLLKKYIDQPIDVICDGAKYSGTLLSFDAAQIVLKEDGGGIVMVQRADNVRDIRFKVLPEGLLTRPTLVWQVKTAKPGDQLVEVTYQTGGLNWHAEYVLVLNGKDTAAGLSGWVSVQNNSGKTYENARIKFIAGDVRRVQRPLADMARMERSMKSGQAAAPMEEKAFFEYHMYTLPRPSTVADNEMKQLEMFTPVEGVKVEKKYLYQPLSGYRWYGGYQVNQSYGVVSPKKVQVYIQFMNTEENGLGIPLPAGKIRCYKQDPNDKALEFVGEEAIDHTPRKSKLSLQVGDAFDITGQRRQTEFSVNQQAHWIKETVEIKIKNAKEDEDAVVRIKEPMYRGQNWKITETNLERTMDDDAVDAHTAVWDVKVPKDGETKLVYKVEYTW